MRDGGRAAGATRARAAAGRRAAHGDPYAGARPRQPRVRSWSRCDTTANRATPEPRPGATSAPNGPDEGYGSRPAAQLARESPPYGGRATLESAHPLRGQRQDRGSARTGRHAAERAAARREGGPEGGAASIVCSGGRAFGYWHIVPPCASRRTAHSARLRQEPRAHVHFAESRSGGTGIRSAPVRCRRGTTHVAAQRRLALRGRAELRDRKRRRGRRLRGLRRAAAPSAHRGMACPGPARLRWRVLRPTERCASVANRSISRTPSPELFDVVYARGTRQNRAGEARRESHWRTRGRLHRCPRGTAGSGGGGRARTRRARLPFTLVNRV